MADFAADLRRLTIRCNFLSEALRDKFVCGVRNTVIQKRLLTEEDTLKALSIAQGMETAHENDENTASATPTVLNIPAKTHAAKRPC